MAGAGCAGCQQVFILGVTSHIASWQLAQEVIIAFAALCLHLYWKHWEGPLFLRRAFSRVAGCCPRAACGTRVLFLVPVASSSSAVCSREAWARGQGASSIDRGVCSGLVGLLSLGLHSSATDMVRVLASTIMGDGLHGVWRDLNTQAQWKFHRNRKRYILLIQTHMPLSSCFQLWNKEKLWRSWV